MPKKIFVTSREIADILKARLGYEVKQRDLAQECGVSPAYMSDFLVGNREVGPTILKALGYEITPYYRKSTS